MEMLTLELAKRYTDSQRLDYSEFQKILILPEQTMTFAQGDLGVDGFVPPFCRITPGWNFENSGIAQVIVSWDGKNYICPLKNGGQTFGNTSIAEGFDNSGEPFAYTFIEDIGGVLFTSEEGTHVVSMVAVIEKVHQIDGKYVVSCVEYNTNLSAEEFFSLDSTDVSEEWFQNLYFAARKAAQHKVPLVIVTGLYRYTLHCYHNSYDAQFMFSGQLFTYAGSLSHFYLNVNPDMISSGFSGDI